MPHCHHSYGSAHETIGRPVRIVSIGFRPVRPLEEIAGLVARSAEGADLILLPEACRGLGESTMEELDGPTIQTMAALAANHGTYIVCPIDRMEFGRRHNSAVVLDRRGRIICVYDKLHPVPSLECAFDPPVSPGEAARVFSADFGKVGLAICFDIQWPRVWESLAEQGAELVLWPSAYSGGRALQAHAITHHYYLITSTWAPDCRVYDIDGSEILHERQEAGGINVTSVTLDLDRAIFHFDLNHPGKLERLLEERGEDVERERYLPLEAWFILKARRGGVSARSLARRYGMEELAAYIRRCDIEIERLRARDAVSVG